MYDIFVLGNNPNWKKIKTKYPFAKKVESFTEAKTKSLTSMFWTVWDDIEVSEDFDFTLSVPKWDEDYVHVFKNSEYFDGLSLVPKNKHISQKEIQYRWFVDKKEIDTVASVPKKYDIFEIETYEQYLEAMDKSTTDMFWMTSPNLKIADGFNFDLYITHHNSYERQENHAFINQVGDEKLYNGIFLLSKHKPVSAKEIEHRYIIERKEWNIVASVPCQYDIFTIETYEQYLEAMEQSKTEMFWMTTPNVKIADNFNFDLYFSHDKIYDRTENHAFVHLVNGEKLYNGVFLISKKKPVSAKEIAHRYIIDRKEWDIVASGPCEYDRFIVDTYEQYLESKSKSKTEMFWIMSSSIRVLDDFKFDLYFDHYNEYDRNITHVFRNSEFYDGLMLTPKSIEISKKEFNSGFIVDRKEHDIMASVPVIFDKFKISSYSDYLSACEKATTGMFWAVWPDVEVVDDFDFDYYVPRYNQHITHVFKNGKYFDGICLFSKYNKVNEKEFKYRFFSEKKEVDYVISYPKPYDIFEIETYEQYLEAMEKSSTDMFWMTTPNVKTANNFKFDLYITHHNVYELQENHAFIHQVGDEQLYNGIFLLSKHKPITKKEIEHRYIVDRKEWDGVASIPCQYDIFEIETYEQYQYALENTKTEMFWMTTPNVKIADDFDFNLYFSHDCVYDRNENHAFVHLVNDEKLYNGVFLLSKHKPVSAKEINHRYIIDRKEWDTVASGPCQYEIFTVDTYEQYQHAFKTAKTEMFYIVPSDVNVLDDFKFDIYYSHDKEFERTIHHALLNGGFYDGIFLTSKHSEISQKEIDSEFIMIRVEEDILASTPIKFDKFEITTYADYLNACDKSSTGMFWAVWPDVEVVDDFDFEYYVPRYNQHITHIFKNGSYFDGICLFNKNTLVNEKEFKYRFFSEKKEVDYVISYPKQYDKFIVDTYEQYLDAKTKSTTDMFYMVPSDINILDDFKYDIYFSHHNTVERQENHALLNGDYYDGIFLVSKYSEISQKEIENKFIVERKEEEILASTPVKFDKFEIATYQDYVDACEKSTTSMFWAVWSDVEVVEDFEFDYYVPRYNQHITHVFKNGEYFDGICLFNKHSRVNEKEFKYRFFSEKKEIDYVISYPKQYDKFVVDTYEQYLEAKANSTTDLFWIVPTGLTILDTFKFDLYYTHHDTYNRTINHVFRNGDFYDGIMLTPREQEISKKEFNSWFVIDRKEHDVLASMPRSFDKFEITTYNDYLTAVERSTTGMFWAVWPDVNVVDDFEFDYYVPRYNQHITHVFKNGEYFDGICLFGKHTLVNEREFKYRFFSEKKEIDYVISYPKPYDKFVVDTYEQYLEAKSNSTTDMFYMIPSDIDVLDDFKFDVQCSRYENHALLNGDYYDGIFLVSKYIEISQKEITNKFIIDRKEEEILASKPVKFDVFYINSYEEYLNACEKSKTSMFWAVWPDVEVVDDFDFDYYVPRYNQHLTHVFKNGEYFDGICLFNKHSRVNEKEFKYRFFNEKKEIDYVISYPKQYDTFTVDTYEQYLEAKTKSTTDLFWIVPTGLKILDNFKLDLYYTHHDTYNRTINHVFRNGDFYDGIMLTPREQEISKKEFNSWFVINRKEHDELASMPTAFDKFEITTYNDYLTAVEKSTTGMFWAVWTDVNVVEDFEFDYYVPRYNQHITHVFKNGEHLDGVCLFSKHYQISKKEFKYRFFNEKKEVDYIASYPKPYDTFKIRNYDDYVNALATSSTDMFWMIPNEVEAIDTFTFDTYFSHHNTYDRNMNHSFKHLFRGEENYNGINLMSKNVPVSEKEITFRYLVERKEWDITASKVKPYDIIFISYNEINADENFDRVNALYPRVKRVHGVKGIHQAHIKAAEQATTDNFWVVDGDAVVVDDFKFDYEIPVWEHDTVHVWRSQNPVNNLVYGYGGVKLLPRQLTLDMDVTRPDMTTSISDKFKPVQIVSNVTAFNTDEFSTWKSAFRECAKLAGKTIDRQVDTETEERLNVWCTEGADKPYGEFAIKGALAGRKFATDTPQDLFKINDFDWLYEQFLNEKNSSK